MLTSVKSHAQPTLGINGIAEIIFKMFRITEESDKGSRGILLSCGTNFPYKHLASV